MASPSWPLPAPSRGPSRYSTYSEEWFEVVGSRGGDTIADAASVDSARSQARFWNWMSRAGAGCAPHGEVAVLDQIGARRMGEDDASRLHARPSQPDSQGAHAGKVRRIDRAARRLPAVGGIWVSTLAVQAPNSVLQGVELRLRTRSYDPQARIQYDRRDSRRRSADRSRGPAATRRSGPAARSAPWSGSLRRWRYPRGSTRSAWWCRCGGGWRRPPRAPMVSGVVPAPPRSCVNDHCAVPRLVATRSVRSWPASQICCDVSRHVHEGVEVALEVGHLEGGLQQNGLSEIVAGVGVNGSVSAPLASS